MQNERHLKGWFYDPSCLSTGQNENYVRLNINMYVVMINTNFNQTNFMNTKFTLSIDKSVIAQAKEYAALQGRSLSDLVENYLKSVSTIRMKSSQDMTIQRFYRL